MGAAVGMVIIINTDWTNFELYRCSLISSTQLDFQGSFRNRGLCL